MSIVFARDPYEAYVDKLGFAYGADPAKAKTDWDAAVAKGLTFEGGQWIKDPYHPVNQGGGGDSYQKDLDSYNAGYSHTPPNKSDPKYAGTQGVTSSGTNGSSMSGLGGGNPFANTPFAYEQAATKVLTSEFDKTLKRSGEMFNEDWYDRGVGNSPAAATQWGLERQDNRDRLLMAITGLYRNPGGGGGGGSDSDPSKPGAGYPGAYDPKTGASADRKAGTTFFGGDTPDEATDRSYHDQNEGINDAYKEGKPSGGGGAIPANKADGEPVRGSGETYDAYMKRWNAWFNSKKKAPTSSGVAGGKTDPGYKAPINPDTSTWGDGWSEGAGGYEYKDAGYGVVTPH